MKSAVLATRFNPGSIPDKLYFRIGDVAELLGVKPYVLRYWETEFSIIAPEKGKTGQRVYTKADVETVMLIKHLLYTERYSIEGARKRLKELKREGKLVDQRVEAVDAVSEDRREEIRTQGLHQAVSELEKLAGITADQVFKLT